MYNDDFGFIDLLLHPVTRIIICIAILFLFYAYVHTPSDNWNDGICPTCDVQYELKAVNGRMYEEFWQCPVCKTIATK